MNENTLKANQTSRNGEKIKGQNLVFYLFIK